MHAKSELPNMRPLEQNQTIKHFPHKIPSYNKIRFSNTRPRLSSLPETPKNIHIIPRATDKRSRFEN